MQKMMVYFRRPMQKELACLATFYKIRRQKDSFVRTHGPTDAFSFFTSNTHTSIYVIEDKKACLLYTSPSPRDRQKSRMPSSA